MSSWRFWVAVAVLSLAAIVSHMRRPMAGIPLQQPLRAIPSQIGDWWGVDMPLESRIAAMAGVDDYLNRVYRANSGNSVGLYVGYYRSQATGESIHSPKNCLPGTGWQPVSSAVAMLPTADGSRVPVNLYTIENANERQVVLYWYQSHGRIVASEYWAKFYMIADAIRMNRTDGALIRINTRIDGNESLARDRVMQFARQLLPTLQGSIPR